MTASNVRSFQKNFVERKIEVGLSLVLKNEAGLGKGRKLLSAHSQTAQGVSQKYEQKKDNKAKGKGKGREMRERKKKGIVVEGKPKAEKA